MSIELFTAALVTGTLVSALAGNLAELRSNRRACLDIPFVDVQRPVKSLAGLMVAGPYYLIGEAVLAREEGRCGLLAWATAVLFCALWCLAMGIVSMELLWRTLQLL